MGRSFDDTKLDPSDRKALPPGTKTALRRLHISRLLCKYDIKDVKRADDDGGVLYCGKRVRTVPDDLKSAGLALRHDQTEFVIARCEPAIMPRVRAQQEGAQCTTSEIRDMRSMTGSLQWVMGGTRPDESFATSQLQRKQSAPLVCDHKRAVQTRSA